MTNETNEIAKKSGTTVAKSDYYDYRAVLSYHCPWNFVIGARGLGKTYGAKSLVIKDWVKRRWQFIYLRRTAVEQRNKGTFFADIAEAFPDLEFRVNGNQAECHWADGRDDIPRDSGEPKKVWHIMGYFIALSQAGQVKSVAYPKVRTIVYDEIFPDNLSYLGGEVTALEEFYNTVDRWNDRVRLIMCSNAVSMANPYFAKFNININDQQSQHAQYRRYCDGFIMVELADYGGFSKKIAASKYGQFLQKYDADYMQYAANNTFRDDTNVLISDLTRANYVWSLRTTEYGEFSVWQTYDTATQSVCWQISRTQPKQPVWLTLDFRLVADDCRLLMRNDVVVQKLKTAYSVGRVRFDSAQIRSEFSMILGGLMAQMKTK